MTTLAADLDTIFVALDRLRTLGWEGQYNDVNLANRGLIALANVRECVGVQIQEKGESR